MTLFPRASARRRGRHQRSSLLAPSRTLTASLGLLGTLGLTIAGCAPTTNGSPHLTAKAAAHPRGPAAAAAVAAVAAGIAGATTPTAAGRSTAADLAALRATRPTGGKTTAGVATGLAASGIPSVALAAYKTAATREAGRSPACGLSWPLLAGIGRVESNHGRFAGAVLHTDGVSTPRIIGIPLDGNGTAVIRDTDGGRIDGDTTYDRAVGPMQFIPSTWASWGVDANHDGSRDPFNIFDAAAAAADYLCAAGQDLTSGRGQVQAILSYNHSYDYVEMVMGLEKVYASGVGVTVPVLPTTLPPDTGSSLPAVDPGEPRGVQEAARVARATAAKAALDTQAATSAARTSTSAASSSGPRSSASRAASSSSSVASTSAASSSAASSSAATSSAATSSAATSSSAPSSSVAPSSSASSSSSACPSDPAATATATTGTPGPCPSPTSTTP